MESLGGELICCICLDIYNDPMMLSCGHNFCLQCIHRALAATNRSGHYTCPECKIQYDQYPVILRNLKLRNIIQGLQVNSQKKLQHSLSDLTREREATEQRIDNLNEQKSKIQETSDSLEKVINQFFTMIEEDIKKFQKAVLGEISRNKEHALGQVSRFIQELEMRKHELSKKIQETQEMLHVDDPTTVLQQGPGIVDRYHQSDSVTVYLDQTPISLTLKRCLSSLIHMLSEFIHSSPGLKPSDVFLDIKSACNYIRVSPDCRSASYVNVDQGYPEGPQRFNVCQVLSTCSFSAQHYWVVDVRKAKEWIVGVVYQTMDRKSLADEAYIGFNDKSWGLEYRQHHHCLSALHNKVRAEVAANSPIHLLGVYVNYQSGLISFYQLGDHMRHLYSFSAPFTEILYAAFCVFPDSRITIRKREPRYKAGR
ncbi:nuclear factor 7, ovary-like [Leptodactylus fuscus]|uniref:nuclear factor 7, ovary-like n=1 Tax=Leptodactylus fuscus TaxID=238119 RepID=UPI003F4F0A14